MGVRNVIMARSGEISRPHILRRRLVRWGSEQPVLAGLAPTLFLQRLSRSDDDIIRALVALDDQDAHVLVCRELIAAVVAASNRSGWDVVRHPEERIDLMMSHVGMALRQIDPWPQTPRIDIRIAIICNAKRTYLREMARLRKQPVDVGVDIQAALAATGASTSDEVADLRDIARLVHSTIAESSGRNLDVDETSMLIVNTRLGGVSVKEASAKLGITAKAGYARRMRGEELLRRQFGQLEAA